MLWLKSSSRSVELQPCYKNRNASAQYGRISVFVKLPHNNWYAICYRIFLEPESEKHSYSPFVSLHLQMFLVSGYWEIINSSGAGKLVAQGIHDRTSTGNDGRREMILHAVTNGWDFCIATPLFCFSPHLSIIMRIYRDGWQGWQMDIYLAGSHFLLQQRSNVNIILR